MAKEEITAFLGSGATYQGRLEFQGAVRIDGNFQGEVESEGTLVIGKEAHIRAQVRVGFLVLSGHMEGDVVAKNRVTMHKTANFHGDIFTPSLVVEDGAILEGRISMNASETTINGTVTSVREAPAELES